MSSKANQRERLYARDGKRCHYCGIEESDFLTVWGPFNGGTRGSTLEVGRKQNNCPHTFDNSVLACAICNNAKSDKFTYDEFNEVGKAIKMVWQQRRLAQGSQYKHQLAH
jgi:hypothetical protein